MTARGLTVKSVKRVITSDLSRGSALDARSWRRAGIGDTIGREDEEGPYATAVEVMHASYPVRVPCAVGPHRACDRAI